MEARVICSRILVVVGLAAMLIGAIDPLEGSFIILPGVAFVVAGAYLARSRHIKLLTWALGLVTFGVAAMVVLSWLGGIGGKSGHSMWWALLIVPYPIGWTMGLIGTIRSLLESPKYRALPLGTR